MESPKFLEYATAGRAAELQQGAHLLVILDFEEVPHVRCAWLAGVSEHQNEERLRECESRSRERERERARVDLEKFGESRESDCVSRERETESNKA